MHRDRGLRVLIPKRVQAEKAIPFLSITVASGLLMVSVYNSLVDAKSWGFDIPASIQRPETCYKSIVTQDVFAPSRDLLTKY
jgi:hypothetical protein